MFELQLAGMDEQTDIQWLDICKASLQLWNLDLLSIEKNVLCNSDSARPSPAPLRRMFFDSNLRFEHFDFQDAEYRVRIDLATIKT